MRRVKYGIIIVFLGVLIASSTLFARVMIEEIHISKDIDEERYIPIDIVDEMPNDSKQVAVSARVRNLPHNKKVKIVWYNYNNKHKKVARIQSLVTPKDHNFLYHIAYFRNMPDAGKYFVDFLVNNRLVASKSFMIYESRSKYTIKWTALNAKGVKLYKKKSYGEAIGIFKNAIKILKKDDPIEYKNILLTLNNMAQTYLSSGNRKASKIILKEASKIANKYNLTDDLYFSRTLSIMGAIYIREFDYTKAIEFYTKSLNINDKSAKSECGQHTIDKKLSLYTLYVKQKDYDNARLIAQETAECHNRSLWSLLMISDTYLAQKDYKISQKYLDKVYLKLKNSKKPNKYIVYTMMNSMSQLYIKTKRYDKAKVVTDKLIKKSKKLYGIKSMQTINALGKLARIYRESGDSKSEKIVENNIDKLYAEIMKSKSCFKITTMQDEFLYTKVHKKYEELDDDLLSHYHIGRYFDKKQKISLIAPLGWQSKDNDKYILYLQHRDKDGNIDRYTLRKIPKFWKNDKSQNYKKLIKKISNDIDNMLMKSAKSISDSTTQTIPIKIFKRGKYTIGHTLIHQKGKLDRWYGNTLIFDGKNIYLLSTISSSKNLLLGEFLSTLAMKSFCGDRESRQTRDIDGVEKKVKRLEQNLSNLESSQREREGWRS